MKIKFDFVTNSSSTSFIVGNLNKEINNNSVTLNIEVNLENFIDRTIKNLDELNCFWEDWFCDEFESVRDQYKECKNIIKRGGVINILRFSSESEDPLEVFIYEHGFKNVELPDNIIIIEGEY